jgi:hypothetical protein
MYPEAIELIEQNPAPCEVAINGIRSIDKIIEHYEGLGFVCEILPDDEDGIKIMKVI